MAETCLSFHPSDSCGIFNVSSSVWFNRSYKPYLINLLQQARINNLLYFVLLLYFFVQTANTETLPMKETLKIACVYTGPLFCFGNTEEGRTFHC